MSRYIDAETIPDLFNEKFKETQNLIEAGETQLDNLAEGFTEAEKIVLFKVPTADVQEVRHGKMNIRKSRSTNRNATYKCSVCWKLCSSYYNDIGEWKFCPHCGARMDGGGKDSEN